VVHVDLASLTSDFFFGQSWSRGWHGLLPCYPNPLKTPDRQLSLEDADRRRQSSDSAVVHVDLASLTSDFFFGQSWSRGWQDLLPCYPKPVEKPPIGNSCWKTPIVAFTSARRRKPACVHSQLQIVDWTTEHDEKNLAHLPYY